MLLKARACKVKLNRNCTVYCVSDSGPAGPKHVAGILNRNCTVYCVSDGGPAGPKHVAGILNGN
jgi:hypothetical protein